jgi:prepilin-type N-terminal cleavage/methylation domain-containing protein
MEKTIQDKNIMAPCLIATDTKRCGFTLIELSIVLVIIGLLVSGVLTGQYLIKAAEMKRFLTQLDSYDAAVNTFSTKYGCLPGDCTNLTTFFTASDLTNGDGDGLINGIDVYYTGGRSFYYETGPAWEVLSQEGLINGSYDVNPGNLGTGWPSIYGRPTSGIGLAAFRGVHYYRTGIFDRFGGPPGPYGGFANFGESIISYTKPHNLTFTPSEAFSIVSKIGDGTATGSIKVVGWCVYNCFDWATTTDSGNWSTIISPGPMGSNQPYCYSGVTGLFNTDYGYPICELAIPANF